MNRRPPQLSSCRLLAAIVLPLAVYLIIRSAVGSATGALAITEAVPATWLLIVAIARRRVEPVAVVATVTIAVALGAYALTGGDPLALKLQHGAVTGTFGIAALASVALRRPLLLVLAERIAKLNPDRRAEIQARLADSDRRRAMTILTAIAGLTFTLDSASQIALALTVPTRTFVADSTATRIVVLGTGVLVTAWYLRHQKRQRDKGRRPPASLKRHEQSPTAAR